MMHFIVNINVLSIYFSLVIVRDRVKLFKCLTSLMLPFTSLSYVTTLAHTLILLFQHIDIAIYTYRYQQTWEEFDPLKINNIEM